MSKGRGGYPRGMGNFGGFNMNNLMKQAQKMQEEMQNTQEAVAAKDFEATAGGGAITAVVSGDKKLKSLSIKQEVVDPDDVEMLEDLIMVAVNDALNKADEASSSAMSKMTGGMGGFPF